MLASARQCHPRQENDGAASPCRLANFIVFNCQCDYIGNLDRLTIQLKAKLFSIKGIVTYVAAGAQIHVGL